MATRGKSINLFLMDDEPSGRIKCTLASWTGVAYKIPRTALDLCTENTGPQTAKPDKSRRRGAKGRKLDSPGFYR